MAKNARPIEGARKNDQQGRHGEADQRREGDEGDLGARDRHRIDAGRDVEHQRQRRQHDNPAQRRHVDRMAQLGQSEAPVPHLYSAEGEGGVGDEAGRAEAEGHVVVDADHVSAQPLIDVGPCDPRAGTGVGVAVKVGHGRKSS